MSQPRDALDLRRATEGVLLDALEVGHPLALAEAYHRTVPAAHAVARRLMNSSEDIEDLLLAAYGQLWDSPPTAGPLEGWIRRTVWTLGVDRLRAAGAAPASPSLAGLVPDLPAPDVRFLDAAERAIAELADDERRALLLAHDKGVPTSAQEEGADQALTRALLTLAGPETSAADRAALDEDGGLDVVAMGDWCMGLATSREETEVDEAIESRPGCAAVSRAARRGRRRVEGLPATPDMGQRVLVQVLTAGSRAIAPPAPAAPDVPHDISHDVPHDIPHDIAPDEIAFVDTAAAPILTIDETGPLPSVASAAGAGPEEDPFAVSEDADPFAPAAEGDPFAPSSGHDPFADLDDDASGLGQADGAAVTGDLDPVGDTADLARADAAPLDDAPADSPQDVDWRPDPGSTAEMRLSDILAEGDDDDPFADLDADDGADGASPNPYLALRGLHDDAEPVDAGTAARDRTLVVDGADDDLVVGYVEGQEQQVTGDLVAPSRTAAVLAWILPILGGSAIGILIAVTVFGPPS